jgi:hypothetical protein
MMQITRTCGAKYKISDRKTLFLRSLKGKSSPRGDGGAAVVGATVR